MPFFTYLLSDTILPLQQIMENAQLTAYAIKLQSTTSG